MKTQYLVTGAAGHLGNTLVRILLDRGETVRQLALECDMKSAALDPRAETFAGNVLDESSLADFFDVPAGSDLVVIHAAGIISVASRYDPRVWAVNVEGTRNMLKMAERCGVKRFIYVSSVHAIPEKPMGLVMSEADHFSPDDVKGQYAKSKAKASNLVLEAASLGLNASIVHPSALIGPGDYGDGYITKLIIQYLKGRLPACVKGGYDMADVRDVARGIIECVNKGKSGRCYILSGGYISIKEFLTRLGRVAGGLRQLPVAPLFLARATASIIEIGCRALRRQPLYTPYSLEVLAGNGLFSHNRADAELGYTTTPLDKTLEDLVRFLRGIGRG